MRRYDILPLRGKGGPVLYRLVFTIRAFADFEELAGVPLFEMSWDDIQPETLVTLMWVCLLDQHPNINREMSETLLKTHKTHGRLKLFNAIKRAQGSGAEGNAEKPKDFWGEVQKMIAALGLHPYEAERYTFAELAAMAEAQRKKNEHDMERVAWQTALLLNPHLKRPVTVDDLLGRKAPPMSREEIEAQFADVRRKRGVEC